MIKNYQDANDILARSLYLAGKAEEDDFARFLLYFQSFKYLSVKYTTSASGDRKIIQDYINHDEIMEMFYDKIDLNDKNLDVFLEMPVYENTYHPDYSKKKCLEMNLPNNWGLIRNEEQKSIKNFQIIHSITGEDEEREFDEVMTSLFNTIYRVYMNATHSYFGPIEDFDERLIRSSAAILGKVLPSLVIMREEDGI